MATLEELMEESAPCAAWLINNVQAQSSGPITALIALEIARRSLVMLTKKVPEIHAQWMEIEKRINELSFSVESLSLEEFELITSPKAGDA